MLLIMTAEVVHGLRGDLAIAFEHGSASELLRTTIRR